MTRSRRQNAADLAKYFLLYPNAGVRSRESIDRFDHDRFSVMSLWTGEPFRGSFPPDLVRLTPGKPVDCMGNPMTWLVVSKRCAACLESQIAGQAQVIPLPVTLADGTVDGDRYCVLNPMVVVDGIYSPGKKKSNVSLIDMVIDERQVPEGTHIFRLKHSETTIVVAAGIVRAIQANDLIGFSASPLDLRS